MALVLVIALSTATFAWYGSSTQATATMATLQATSGAGNLEISNDGETWGPSASFTVTNATSPLIPASIKGTAGVEGADATVNVADFADYTKWFKGSLNADGSTNNVEAMGSTDNYVRVYTVYLRNVGTDAIKVNLSGLQFTSAASTDDPTPVQNASEQLKNQCAYMILNGNNIVCNSQFYATAAAGAELTTGLNIPAQAPSTTGAVDVPAYIDGDTSTVVTLTVYNWIDGWDASSELDTNSQRGKVTFGITFDTYIAA